MSGQNSQSENLRGEVTNFGKQIDFSKDLTEGDINGYIAWRIAIWEDSRYRDRDLWIAFIDDFDDFKKDTFDIASKDYRIKLRDYLRANGVFVRKQPRLSIVSELCNVLMEDEQHKWTNEEIEDQINSAHGFNSLLKSRLPAILTTPATISTTIPAPPAAITTTMPAPAGVTTTVPVPPLVTTTIGHGRELANLAKVYEDEVKYDGEMDTSNHDKADIVNSEGEGRGNEDTPLDKLDLHDDFETPSLDTDDDSEHGSDQTTTIFTTINGRDMLEKFATHHIVTKDIRVIAINIPIRRIIFDVVTLFLLCLRNMDRLGIYLDNYPMHGKSPSRFLHDDADFKCSIYVDMMYIQILIVIYYCMLPMKILTTGCEI